MAAQASQQREPDSTDGISQTHRLKLRPPTFDGNYNTYEEWTYKFTAYMGLKIFYPRMFRLAEQATQQVTEQHLRVAASTLEEAEQWIQLDNHLKYVLINITTGSAATICRQHQHEIGLEILRQLHIRFALPVGTRSIGYLTKLVKPTFDTNNFEESLSNWEFELNRYERDNNTQLPDQVKIAILFNETKGPLQQHLQLNARSTPTYNGIRNTIMEYYRNTTAFTRLQQNNSSSVATHFGGGLAPMDISAINKGKGKHKGKNKGKGKKGNEGRLSYKGYKGKGYGQQGTGKGHIGQANTPYGNKGYSTRKGKMKATGSGKGKGKAPTQGCYKCGQPGHFAKDWRTAVYSLQEVDNSEWQQDATSYWYGQKSTFDNNWWTDDQTQVHAVQQQQPQLALPPPQQADPLQTIQIAAIRAVNNNCHGKAVHDNHTIQHTTPGNNLRNELMIDSGAATHVCPPWFAASTPTHQLQPWKTPNLRMATEDTIEVTGYKWVYMTNKDNQQIVIPFYVCSVTQPILSVTRLAEQGFIVQLSEKPTITHPSGFGATLNIKEGTYYLPVKTTGVPHNYKLGVHETQEGVRATISPITLTPAGAQWATHQHDIWTYNSQGYLDLFGENTQAQKKSNIHARQDLFSANGQT